jgi:hypothetical protein
MARAARTKARESKTGISPRQALRRWIIGALAALALMAALAVWGFVGLGDGTTTVSSPATALATTGDYIVSQSAAKVVAQAPTRPDHYASLRFEQAEGVTFIGETAARLISPNTLAAIEAKVTALEQYGNAVGFVLYDLETGLGLAYNADGQFYGASSVKGSCCASLIANKPEAFVANRSIIEDVLISSSNEGYQTLFDNYRWSYLEQWYLEADTELTGYNKMYPNVTARDLARLWVRNQQFFVSGAEHAAELCELYTRPNNSPIHMALGWSYTTYSKAGWWYPGAEDAQQSEKEDEDAEQTETAVVATEAPCVVDGGIVLAGEDGSHPYILALTSDRAADFNGSSSLAELLDQAHNELITPNEGQQ